MDTDDPRAVWSTLIDRLGQRAWSWLRFLEIEQIEEQRVVLRVAPGHREVLGFCTEARLEQIGEHLRPILGRRVRVRVEAPPSADPHAGVDPGDAAAGTAPTPSTHRREAMNLPLVQRALEAFPDATLMDARDDAEPPPAADDTASPDAPPASDT